MKTKFIYQDTQLPEFLQCPEFLLHARISQTAKLIYLLLYNRARVSRQNGWTDGVGRVYIIFPIEELCEKSDKSPTTVKVAMKELCKAGLLLKMQGAFGEPNRLYVLYAQDGRLSDRDEKQSIKEADISPSDSRLSDHSRGGKQPPNKVMNQSNQNQSNRVRERKPRGRYENVFLSDREMDDLKQEYPVVFSRYLEELSEYIASTGKEYANYAAALRRWAANDKKAGQDRAFENYDCCTEDSF